MVDEIESEADAEQKSALEQLYKRLRVHKNYRNSFNGQFWGRLEVFLVRFFRQ